MERYNVYGSDICEINIDKEEDGDWVKYEDLPKWVSINKSLPNNGVSVLGRTVDGFIFIVIRVDTRWETKSFGILGEVKITHWYPIPEFNVNKEVMEK